MIYTFHSRKLLLPSFSVTGNPITRAAAEAA
jgi:hypothetical protein